MRPKTTLKHLGRQSRSAARLDVIPLPGAGIGVTVERDLVVTLTCTEFTSLCPVTGQPDFGVITIEYTPDRGLVETKSLKLWLRRWRNRAAFNEAIVVEIVDLFFAQVKPVCAVVTGVFNVRGGIQPTATARRVRVS